MVSNKSSGFFGRAPISPPATSRCKFDSLSFDAPIWEERRVVAFFAPEGRSGAPRARIVVAQERLAEGETARAFVSSQLADASLRLPEFTVRSSRDIVVAGRAALFAAFAWRMGEEDVEQTMVLLERQDDARKVITLMTLAATEDADATAVELERLLANARFDDAPTPPVATPPEALFEVPMPGVSRRGR